jgi:hypothetical protein
MRTMSLTILRGQGSISAAPQFSTWPDALEDVYRKFLQRELASTPARWNDVYRPLLGLIAVARGDGLSKAQLIDMTGLAQDTANDVLTTSRQSVLKRRCLANRHSQPD